MSILTSVLINLTPCTFAAALLWAEELWRLGAKCVLQLFITRRGGLWCSIFLLSAKQWSKCRFQSLFVNANIFDCVLKFKVPNFDARYLSNGRWADLVKGTYNLRCLRHMSLPSLDVPYARVSYIFDGESEIVRKWARSQHFQSVPYTVGIQVCSKSWIAGCFSFRDIYLWSSVVKTDLSFLTKQSETHVKVTLRIDNFIFTKRNICCFHMCCSVWRAYDDILNW